MKPSNNLLYWKPGQYVNAASTNVAKTFERIRREQRRAQVEAQPTPPEHRVIPILKRKA